MAHGDHLEMFTVCPKCALTLAVTAADLRVAQGYVRCGRCSSVFNALARLTDDRHAAELMGAGQTPPTPASESPHVADSTELVAKAESRERAPSEAQPTAPSEAPAGAESTASHAAEPAAASAPESAPAQEPTPPAEPLPGAVASGEETIPEAALEFDATKTDVSAVFIAPPPDPEWTAATGTFKAMIASGQAPAPQPSGPDAVDSSSAPTPAATSPSALDADVGPGTAPAPLRPVRRSTPHPRPSLEAATRGSASAPEEREDVSASLFGDSPAPSAAQARRPSRRWSAAAAIAVLLLLTQIVHHYRDELAANTPLHRPLTALYAALGMPLVPRWDLHAYDVRQLGASVDPASAGLITVRASIKNAAQQPQPLPLLRVTLQDRFGNRIAARDVAPRSYLPRSVSASSYIAAGQRIDAEMGFVDPGSNAVGFEIDACLPARGGGVACANESALR